MIVTTKNFGRAEIIGDGSKYNYLKVRFLNTGHIDEFRKDAVLRGEIRDKYAVSVCGVGIVGNIKTRGKFKPFYTCWKNMIIRCCSDKNAAHRDASVCERWLTFEYFYYDIQLLDGWNAEKFRSGEIEIDKDVKQRYQKSKIYSPTTCVWLETKINAKIQDGQQNPFIAISPNGDKYSCDNISKFAREHNLERKQISAVLHNRFNSTMGWKFSFIDKEIV